MIETIDPAKVLYFDIETVSEKASYADLSKPYQKLWTRKAHSLARRNAEEDPLSEEEVAKMYKDKSAIFAEFGKVVCISIGFLIKSKDEDTYSIYTKSYYGKDERELLSEFVTDIDLKFNNSASKKKEGYKPIFQFFCGHNIKEFDIPYLCRRMVANKVPSIPTLQIAGKKPWDLHHFLDTLEYWKFGDRKNFTSLNLLAELLDFPTPKSGMDGSRVGVAFWEGDKLDEIAKYCEQDVVASAQLFFRLRLDELIPEGNIHSRTFEQVTDEDGSGAPD